MARNPRQLPSVPEFELDGVVVVEELPAEQDVIDAEAWRAYADWLNNSAPRERRDIGSFARSGPPG